MKRTWEATGQEYAPHPPANQHNEPLWTQMPSHPYAQAYSSMSNPFTPQTLQGALNGGSAYDPNLYPSPQIPAEKRSRMSEAQEYGLNHEETDGEEDDDDEDEDGDEGPDGSGKGTPAGRKRSQKNSDSKKVKLTRGSRACIACRKIKMRCVPDESPGPNGPCRRCKVGGHECVFEESNRGKRSTKKNEALAAKVGKMEAALQRIGATLSNLDQTSLNSFSTALHSVTSDPEIIQIITSHTSPAAVPTLAVAMNRPTYPPAPDSYSGSYDMHNGRGEDSAHQPPLSPRLHSLPDNVLSPLGLLAEASLQNTDPGGRKHHRSLSGSKPAHRPSPLSFNETSGYRMATSSVRGGNGEDELESEDRGGVASQNYFRPGAAHIPMAGVDDDRVPEPLTIMSREEMAELFDIFFDHMSPHVPLLYRDFHTPDLVLQRSQFLCTVICAISARYYTKNPDLHARLSAHAKRLAFEVPSRGYKSVEVCQAYLLLSLWTLGPEKTFEQDRTWLMLGMAIRMATDLNLHRKSVVSGLDTDEGRARDLEIINRERTWLLCFILDRSISAQMGKPYTLREDYIIRNACEASWHQQRFSLPSDRALAAYVVLQQIMSRVIDSIYSSTTTISGLRQDCDYLLIVRSAHEELRRWLTEWNKPESFASGDSNVEYDSRAQFYYAYSSLVLYSFGLENAVDRAKTDISFFLTNVYEAATRVCTVVKEEFLHKGYLPYLPDTNFVMCSYALLSLLKLLKPELQPYHDSEEAIFKLVSEVENILESCAVDPSHQPAIYAAFIREIVRKTRELRRGPSAQPSRMSSPDVMGNGDPTGQQGQVYDPQLMDQAWSQSQSDVETAQFQFIPQGGDMMILPSAAGPSQSMQSSPAAHLLPSTYNIPTPQAQNAGWAEYLPTFMSSDGFDGWDGSMLLPGFGRGQITLSGGLLHSQYGSGIITPAQHTPSQSRAASRVASRAQSPL
ncbi:hypothetical protein TREMEDRAFT_67782 [Tremella mesenterica DSM 1558]|uniref:uncharacterized protein n=1 Tax=Tremella mesenterica (strain ATCC 24925 / CBS 8224 / DSM 1558 / NBRC 9311 / NRRL Y-6157 / RJB 2259-6 / UBC 559-6) TaxID=578456 RepID=UPI0003F4987E|nr:uncharacterized protein TREMEDRAFT_67782 [Tremella mesenterica DSM 1558]EIW71458.1 hypothetical protein TREMEDRAFT_67782 [Tremella mesenterica DSM 1558]